MREQAPHTPRREERVLAANAVIALEYSLEQLQFFRPRRGESGEVAALMYLQPLPRSRNAVNLFDQREDSVVVADGITALRSAERREASRNVMDKEKTAEYKREAQEAWPIVLNANAKVIAVYESFEQQGRERWQLLRIILREPEDKPVDGTFRMFIYDGGADVTLDIRNTRGAWYKIVTERQRGRKHFALAMITSSKVPLMFSVRDIRGKKLTHLDYSVGDEIAMREIKADVTFNQWVKGTGPAATEEADDPATHSITVLTDNEGITSALIGAGYDTCGRLVSADPKQVREDTNLKVSDIRPLIAAAKRYVAGEPAERKYPAAKKKAAKTKKK